MKRVVLGLIVGLLMAPSAPQAEKEDETLALLCKRFEATGGATLAAYVRANELDPKTLRKEPGKAPLFLQTEDKVVIMLLRDMRNMVCVK